MSTDNRFIHKNQFIYRFRIYNNAFISDSPIFYYLFILTMFLRLFFNISLDLKFLSCNIFSTSTSFIKSHKTFKPKWYYRLWDSFATYSLQGKQVGFYSTNRLYLDLLLLKFFIVFFGLISTFQLFSLLCTFKLASLLEAEKLLL